MGELPSSAESPVLLPDRTDRLRDGTPVLVRRALPEDREMVIEFLRRTSRAAIQTRFFSSVSEDIALTEVVRTSDPSLALSLLLYCEVSNRSELAGHGEYVRDGPHSPSAEIAFLVTDVFQGKGVATILLKHLARVARREGIRTFRAMVLRSNSAMIEVFRGCGFSYAIENRPDRYIVTLTIQDEPHPSFERATARSPSAGVPPTAP